MVEPLSNAGASSSEKPSVTNTGAAFGELYGWLRALLAGLAGLSGCTYALGYLITTAQMRMLGVGAVDISDTQQIVKRALGMVPLTMICMLVAMIHPAGLVLGATSLLAYFRPSALGLFRQDLGETPSRYYVRTRRLRLSAAMALLLVSSIFAFRLASVMVEEGLLLHQDSPLRNAVQDGEAAESDEGELTQFLFVHSLSAEALVRDQNLGRTRYGLYAHALVLCITLWLGLWFRFAASTVSVLFFRQFAKIILVVAGLMLAVLVIQVPMLYGYLAAPHEFPTIESRWQPPDVETPKPKADVKPDTSPEASPPTSSTPTKSAEWHKYLVLGTSHGRWVLYSMEQRRIWQGVDKEADNLLPARQLPPTNPFERNNR